MDRHQSQIQHSVVGSQRIVVMNHLLYQHNWCAPLTACVYMEVVDCTCMGRGRMKGWSVRAWGEGGRRVGVCVHGEEDVYTGGVDFMYMEGLETHHPSPHARTFHPFSLYTSTLSPCTHTPSLPYTHILSMHAHSTPSVSHPPCPHVPALLSVKLHEL